jgi:hypothetical protein
MPGRVRRLDRLYVRLSDQMLTHVDHLAHLAGVSASDVINYVLSEAFESGHWDSRDEESVSAPAPMVPRIGGGAGRRQP